MSENSEAVVAPVEPSVRPPAPAAWLHIVRATGDGRQELDAALSFAPDNFPLQGLFESVSVEPLYDGSVAAECAALRLRLTMAREATLQARAHLLNGPKHAGWALIALRLALDALDGLRDDERPNVEGEAPTTAPRKDEDATD